MTKKVNFLDSELRSALLSKQPAVWVFLSYCLSCVWGRSIVAQPRRV